jgi:hypothetical protein
MRARSLRRSAGKLLLLWQSGGRCHRLLRHGPLHSGQFTGGQFGSGLFGSEAFSSGLFTGRLFGSEPFTGRLVNSGLSGSESFGDGLFARMPCGRLRLGGTASTRTEGPRHHGNVRPGGGGNLGNVRSGRRHLGDGGLLRIRRDGHRLGDLQMSRSPFIRTERLLLSDLLRRIRLRGFRPRRHRHHRFQPHRHRHHRFRPHRFRHNGFRPHRFQRNGFRRNGFRRNGFRFDPARCGSVR